jgi:Domain of unknown function (DUF1990)
VSGGFVQIIWRFLGQQPDLARLEPLPLTPGVGIGPGPGDRQDSYERVMAQEAPGAPEPAGPFELLAKAILGYEIFPPQLVSGVLRRNPVQVGDTYGICYHFWPGIDFFFAGRVVAVFREEAEGVWRAGFTFRTVIGHPELGEETFWVEKDKATGAVRAGLRSWSRPGTWWTRLGKPYARRVQVRACHAALDNLQRVAQSAQKQKQTSDPAATA